MRHVRASHAGLGVAVIFLLSACTSSAAPPSGAASATVVSPTAATAADTIARQWLAAVQAKDIDAMAALWAP
jgi:hypothetical protein